MTGKYNRKGLFTIILLLVSVSAAGADRADYPLTLREAIEQTLVNNLNLKLQKEDTEIAQGSVKIAESRFDSQLTAEVGIEHNENPLIATRGVEEEDSATVNGALSKRFTTGTEVEVGIANTRYDADASGLLLNPSYGNSIRLGISQPLLRGWGRDIQTAPVTAAEDDLSAATYQVDSVAANLAAQVKNSYWELVYAWQDIEVKKLSVTLAKKLLEETEAKINAGKLAQVELYQPQSEVARREEDLIAAERAIGVADDNLKLLMNSSDWLTAFKPMDLPDITPVQLHSKRVLESAMANRPDLKAAEKSIQAAKIREKVAEDDLRPSLALIGSLGVGGSDDEYTKSYEATIDDTETNWQLGLNLTLPIDNSAARGALQQASASYSRARTSMQLLKLEITKEVRSAVRDVQLAIKAMEATRKTSIATEKRLEAEQAKFDAGRSTTLDVLIAQEAYSQALSQENRTDIQYQQALAELDRIQGKVTLPGKN